MNSLTGNKNIPLTPRQRLALIIAVVFLFGCGKAPPHIELLALSDANAGLATQIDIVFVSDDTLRIQLDDLTGKEWFEQKALLAVAHANNLSIVSAEVVADSSIKSLDLTKNSGNAVGAFVYANLSTPNLDKIEITNVSSFRIQIGKNSIDAIPVVRPN